MFRLESPTKTKTILLHFLLAKPPSLEQVLGVQAPGLLPNLTILFMVPKPTIVNNLEAIAACRVLRTPREPRAESEHDSEQGVENVV